MKIDEKLIQKIVSRKIKGYAFMRYPLNGINTPEEYRKNAKTIIENDFKKMSVEEFKKKYSQYIY